MAKQIGKKTIAVPRSGCLRMSVAGTRASPSGTASPFSVRYDSDSVRYFARQRMRPIFANSDGCTFRKPRSNQLLA